MIRHIAAIDRERGLAKNGAMPPWKLPTDEAYFTEQTLRYGGVVLMGRKTFSEALKNKPLLGRTNYVLTHDSTPISGAIVVTDLARFKSDWPTDKDLWIIGGAELFAQTMDWADELYITEIDGMFGCDRFYPPYQQGFKLVQDSGPRTENGLTYCFRIYQAMPTGSRP